MLVFFDKLKAYGISGLAFGLISSFLNNRRLRVVLDRKSLEECLVIMVFLKAPFLILHFSYCISITCLMSSVILLSMLIILPSALRVTSHLICDKN